MSTKNCNCCPSLTIGKSEGGYAVDWFCSKMDDKKIAEDILLTSDEPEKVPEWCPCGNGTNEES